MSGRAATVLPPSRALMSQARTLVDYALVRRRTLTSYAAGRLPAGDICDAQPYLLRAARYHGEATGEECPVCHRAELVRVNYTYGDCFRADANGRARATGELLGLAGELSEFTVFCVEVCQDCRWNHLLASYVLGTGERVGRRARS